MPSSRHFFHKNRSQGSLFNNQDPNDRRPSQVSIADSPLHSPAFPPHSTTSASTSPQDDGEEYRFDQTYRSDVPRASQFAIPSRSQSQRSPPPNYGHQPTIHLVTPGQSGIGPSAVEENPDIYYQQAPTANNFKDDRKRRFFGLGNLSSTKEPVTNHGGAVAQKPGRSISVRRKVPAPSISTEVASRPLVQQKWSAAVAPSASEGEEEDDGSGAILDPAHIQPLANSVGPPLPDKDSSRSSRLPPPPPPHQEYPLRKTSLPGVSANTSVRQPLERQTSSNPSLWENTVRPIQQYYVPSDAQSHQQQSYQPSPSSATSTSSHPLLSRVTTETPQEQHQEQHSRPSSRHSFGPPSPVLQNSRVADKHPYRASLNQSQPNAYTPSAMAPPPAQQPSQGRGSNELPPQNQPVLNREGSGYQPYAAATQGQNQASASQSQYGGQLAVNPPGATYRGAPQPPPMAPQPSTDTGRSTPPPSRSRDDLSTLDVAQLLTRHDELQEKYRKVKKYYFDKDAQVQQLQNTLAHQRLSQSRTSLDDNEYALRFSRLDGAINNLSFNIRRDWRAVPPWLAPSVNRDAPTNPTKEMTAVGRACISRWLVDELLDRYFHPSLDPALSAHLKIIEKNLRRYAAPTPSEEEKDALMARISNWRLATLDGLQDMLSSPQAAEYRTALTGLLVEKMTASLCMSLKDPPPPGLEGGVVSIVELAVGLAANLPLESRDVFVNYVAPGTLVNEAYMKIEPALPPLVNPGDSLSEGAASEKSPDDSTGAASDTKDERPGDEATAVNNTGTAAATTSVTSKEQKKKSMFGGLMGGSKKSGATAAPQQQAQPPPAPKEERVRFAAFMAVEVRGRSVLVKAPVYV